MLQPPSVRSAADTGPTREKLRDILQAMARTLAGQLKQLEALARTERIATFVRYKQIRERYLAARDLIDAMGERYPPIKDMMPPEFPQWLVKGKLRALAAYAVLADGFFREPPETVTRSLGAYEVLSDERNSMSRTLSYFDDMLMEAAVDDRAADALEGTRRRIEQVINGLDLLLMDSPSPLPELE